MEKNNTQVHLSNSSKMRIVYLTLILSILLTMNTSAQTALRFKLYDQEVVFDESYLDQSFAAKMETNKTFLKNRDLAYNEYYSFKSIVSKGNNAGQYIVVNNLRRFNLYPFENNYFAQEGTDLYKSLLYVAKKEGRSDSFKKTNKVRNDILSWIIDLIISNAR